MAISAVPDGTGVIAVETVVQRSGSAILDRAVHRVPAGFTIRGLLEAIGAAAQIRRIADGEAGLARHGERAWLDDRLRDGDRVEIVEPIVVDAKAARRARVAAERAAERAARGQGGADAGRRRG